MNELGGPLIGIVVGVFMLVASRRYIRDAEEFARTTEDGNRRRYWSIVARWERRGSPIAWALIAYSLVVLVTRLL